MLETSRKNPETRNLGPIHKISRLGGVSRGDSLWRIGVLRSIQSPGEIRRTGWQSHFGSRTVAAEEALQTAVNHLRCVWRMTVQNLSLCRSEYLSCLARTHLSNSIWKVLVHKSTTDCVQSWSAHHWNLDMAFTSISFSYPIPVYSSSDTRKWFRSYLNPTYFAEQDPNPLANPAVQ